MKHMYNKFNVFLLFLLIGIFGNLNGQNLLLNSGFETGLLPPWTAGNGNVVTIVDGAQDGKYAARGNIEQLVNLEANKKYTVTCYAKNDTPSLNVWLGVTNAVTSTFISNFLLTSSTYEKASITFTTTVAGNYRIWVWGVANTDYTSDNFVLLKEGTSSIKSIFSENDVEIKNNLNSVSVSMKNELQDGHISVIDLSGRVLYNVNMTSKNMVIGNEVFPSSGAYALQVRAGNQQIAKQIVVFKN
jgi:hypothetical protein